MSHDLATNALRYGALSVPGRRVEIRGPVTPAEGKQRMVFSWMEIGGWLVPQPSRKAFGTRLIDTMGRTFNGRSELRHDPSGVGWVVEADGTRLKLT